MEEDLFRKKNKIFPAIWRFLPGISGRLGKILEKHDDVVKIPGTLSFFENVSKKVGTMFAIFPEEFSPPPPLPPPLVARKRYSFPAPLPTISS